MLRLARVLAARALLATARFILPHGRPDEPADVDVAPTTSAPFVSARGLAMLAIPDPFPTRDDDEEEEPLAGSVAARHRARERSQT